jgi:hypothetical protein
MTSIELSDCGVRIHDLEIPSREVADYLQGVPEEERGRVLIRAVEVGVFCLERARTGQDLEFVRRQVEWVLGEVGKAVNTIPGAVQEELIGKIGTAEGQVLAPVAGLVEQVKAAAEGRLKEVRELLSQEIDPSKESSVLGKALKNLRDLLDPNREDSIQGRMRDAIRGVTAEDGALAKSVKAVVVEAIGPLKGEIDELGKEIRGRAAAEEALRQTTEKGLPYEEQVVRELQPWSNIVGAEVCHVGQDNRPGDVLFRLRSDGLSLIIEVRDRQQPWGRKAISDCLNDAMAERGTNAGLYLSRTVGGLAKEIGDWAEGECRYGPWVATTHEHLITAVRFLIVQQRIAQLRASKREIDTDAIEAQIGRIRTALDRITTIKKKVSDLRRIGDEIQSEADRLREEARDALLAMEEAVHTVSGGPVAA